MEQAKVYFSDLRCQPGTSLLNKLEKLIRTAGIDQIDFDRVRVKSAFYRMFHFKRSPRV